MNSVSPVRRRRLRRLPGGWRRRALIRRALIRRALVRRALAGSPFVALGLAARPDLTDDEVRSAWRRVAAACHPDRADGGDPARFAAAAAAYTTLRTASGRGEALADLGAAAGRAAGTATASAPADPGPANSGAWPSPAADSGPGRLPGSGAAGQLAARIRRGRPWRLALRAGGAAGAMTLAVIVAGTQPAALALVTGAATWLVLTVRHDIAPPGD